MSDEGITCERDGAVLDIVLDRPANGNLLDAEMGAAIMAAITGLAPDVKLIRLRARGADFCLGRVSPLPPKDSRPHAETLRQRVTAPALALYDTIKAAPVPVLGVVRGRAVGVGCALAGLCDVLLCADDARFSVPEMERDIPPTLVMSALIGRVPLKTVAHLVLSRDVLDAEAALRAGLVSAVVAADRLDAEAARLAAVLCTCSVVTLRAVKEFLRLAPEMPQHAASGLAAHLGATALSARF